MELGARGLRLRPLLEGEERGLPPRCLRLFFRLLLRFLKADALAVLPAAPASIQDLPESICTCSSIYIKMNSSVTKSIDVSQTL